MTLLRDPRLDLPDDLDDLADLIPPAGPGLSGLRRLIGLLHEPLRSVQPRLANEADEASSPTDPQAAVGSGLGSQTGLGTGTTGTNQGSIPGSMILPGTVSGEQIADNSIGAGNIQADSITANEIAAESITANELAANSVSADELQANSVSADEIVSGTITAAEIATGSITGVQLEDGSIGGLDIAATTITANKLSTGTITAMSIDITPGAGNALVVRDGGGTATGVIAASGGVNFNIGNFELLTIPGGGNFFAAPGGIVELDSFLSTANGVSTRVVGGAFSNVPPNQNGQIGIDSTNGRFYFHYSGGWHYVAQTAGIEIPEYERMCPACGNELLVNDAVVARITDIKPDGARHGMYVHFGCASAPLDQALVDAALDQGAAGASGGEPVPPQEAGRVNPLIVEETIAEQGARLLAEMEARMQETIEVQIIEGALAEEAHEEAIEQAADRKAAIVKTK